MTRFTRIKLKNMSPLHLGLGRDSYDVAASVLQSDMLSAALASVRAMHGKGETTKEFLSSFAISSAFPYDGEELFLPRMKGLLNIKVKGQEEKDYRKKLKKLVYISTPIWMQLTAGKSIEVEDDQLHGKFLLERPIADFKAPMMHVTTERVSVSRTGEEDALPFMFDWTFFKHTGNKENNSGYESESGLYCLLKADEDITKEIVQLFEELGTLGIGSDKSVGGGHFTIESDTVDFPEVNSKKCILLSTYIPEKSELESINLHNSNYQLVHRGGFMAGSTNENLRHLRRSTVYMFDTGSVLATETKLSGNVVNVAPEWNTSDMHPVYRSGIPLSLHIV